MTTRLGAVGGFTFLALGWASMGLVPQPPGPEAGAPEWIRYFEGSTGAIQANAFIYGIVVLALLVWFGGMRRHVWGDDHTAPWGPVATVGFSLLATGLLVGAGVASVVAMRLDALDPGLVLFGSSLTGVLYAFGQFGLAAVMGGITAQAQHAGSLPRWLVVLGWVGAAASLATGAGMATASEAVLGAMFISWIAFSVWVAGSSVLLWKGAKADEAAGVAAAAGRPTPTMSGLG